MAINKLRSRTSLDGDPVGACGNKSSGRCVPRPSNGHVHGGDMYRLSKFFGAEHVWMAILLILIKTVRMHKLGPNPNDDHAHGGGMD